MEHPITCPRCGCDNNHPIFVKVDKFKGNRCVGIDSMGVSNTPSITEGTRGVVITLTFGCEWGHVWDLKMQFHKGSTYSHVENVRISDPATCKWNTIWRD